MSVALRLCLAAALLCTVAGMTVAGIIEVPLKFTSDTGKYEFSYPGMSENSDNTYLELKDTVTICGRKVKAYGKKGKNNQAEIGFDCNGDGTVSDDEKKAIKLHAQNPAEFKLVMDIAGEKRDLTLKIQSVFCPSNDSVYALLKMPVWSMNGKFGDTTVFLRTTDKSFSTNKNTVIFLDAQAAADSKDKKTLYGLPLKANIAIMGKYYKTTIASDGAKLTLEEVDASNYGQVALTGTLDDWKTLVLSSKDTSCDLVNSGVKTLPAGEYRIVCGNYGKWDKGLDIYNYGPKTKRKYIIKAQCLNTIKMGPPFELSFTANVKDQTVNVEAKVALVGTGGEKYNYDGDRIAPVVSIFKDTKLVSRGMMEYG